MHTILSTDTRKGHFTCLFVLFCCIKFLSVQCQNNHCSFSEFSFLFCFCTNSVPFLIFFFVYPLIVNQLQSDKTVCCISHSTSFSKLPFRNKCTINLLFQGCSRKWYDTDNPMQDARSVNGHINSFNRWSNKRQAILILLNSLAVSDSLTVSYTSC